MMTIIPKAARSSARALRKCDETAKRLVRMKRDIPGLLWISIAALAVISLVMFMLNNRMVVAGPLYRNDKTGSVWGELGSAAMTGPLDPGVSEQELDAARRLGDRIARLAKKTKGTR